MTAFHYNTHKGIISKSALKKTNRNITGKNFKYV